MQSSFFRWLYRAALGAMLVVTAPAHASTSTTNFSDLWYNASESGWGVNVSQQADVMFVTFFVYGPNRQAIWYTATLFAQGVTVDGSLFFAGDLYQTSGPWFGGPFNPNNVSYRKAGGRRFRVRQARLRRCNIRSTALSSPRASSARRCATRT